MNAIEIVGLSKRFDSHFALRDVSLSVPSGAIYALLGPNGAGKTTLVHILMGLRQADTGSIRLLGKDQRSLTLADRAQIGYVAEAQKLPGWMTLGALEAFLAPLYPTWDGAFASELRNRLRLRSTQVIKTMSRGESMKTALICALAPKPKLLVMDEPFTGVDVAAKDDLVRGILLAASEVESTIVISSHDIAELEPMCDWLGFLDQGELKVSRSIDSLREEYRDTLPVPSLREMFIALTKSPTPVPEPVP